MNKTFKVRVKQEHFTLTRSKRAEDKLITNQTYIFSNSQ